MLRRLLAAALVATAAFGLTGCYPAQPPRVAGVITVSVRLDAVGGGQTNVYLDSQVRSKADLTRLGEQLAPLLFPAASRRTVAVAGSSGGYPSVHITAEGVYEPGPHPDFALESRSTVSLLLHNGFRSVHLSVKAPDVPVTANWVPSASTYDRGSWTWDTLVAGASAPAGSIEMAPEPWRGLVPLALTFMSLGLVICAFIALRRRRRLIAAAGACAAAGAFLVTIMTTDKGVAADNLGVAGDLSGGWLTAATLLPALSSPVVLAAVGVFIAALVTPRARPTLDFNTPPGWPTPPHGWRPGPGWTPDPSWPPAPPDWDFYLDASGRNEQ